VIAECGLHVLRHHDRRLGGDHVEDRPEALERKDLGQVRTIALLVEHELGELPVLGRELGRRRELDRLRVAQRALREGREPPDRLDLVAEELQPSGAVLGGAEDVEDAAAHGELPTLLDLVDALVPGLREAIRDSAQVHLRADTEAEPGRAKRGVRNGLGERHGARHDHRRAVRPGGAVAVAGNRGHQRVERGDPQADEVGRWG
jgi:hypothetical protein